MHSRTEIPKRKILQLLLPVPLSGEFMSNFDSCLYFQVFIPTVSIKGTINNTQGEKKETSAYSLGVARHS